MTSENTPEFDSFLSFAHVLADRSADVIMPHFRKISAVENKADPGFFDPVTEADRAAEQVIRAEVETSLPSHAVLGEEFGLQPAANGGRAEYCWIVDPIDGTRSFISGVPLWGTLIGLKHNGRMILGMMNQPFTGERYWSGATGAMYRGPDGEKEISTRSCAQLSKATLLATGPEFFSNADDLAHFEALSDKTNLRRYGGDCYCYCMLAAGHADLVVEAGLASYDIAALIPVIEKAGGRITTWEGKTATEGGRIIASGDPALHDAALKILAG